jgi:2-polyprenyl-6-hydroxyphenyl methylase/3-demethylubiquinone-9 3-methyltransferase
MIFRRLLAAKGIHYCVTRFGPQRLRSMAFDEKYRRGHWRFQGGDSTGELPGIVRRYLRQGDLLVLGCGGSAILEGLEADGVNSVLGLDLSEEALRLASRYASSKVIFQIANMETFACPRSYDVILFSESLNYVPGTRQIALLNRLGVHLKPGGAFVVTLAESKRYEDIIERVRENFQVLEDHLFPNSTRHLLIFQVR